MEKVNDFLKYLFDTTPGTEFKYYLPLIIFAGLLIVAGIVFMFIYNKRKKYNFAFKRMFKNTSRNLMLFGILFLFLVGTRYENIPYFEMRFLLYISLLGLAYMLYRYIKTYKIDYKKELASNPKSILSRTTIKKAIYSPNKKKK